MLLGREVIFDVADATGDAVANRRTFPILFGDLVAIRIAVVLQLTGCVLLIIFGTAAVWSLSPSMRLLLCCSLAFFTLILMPINLKLILRPRDSLLVKLFTLRTRLAMLLLPLITFALMSGQ
jgi:4-hydroxybenzoate polyprenyltransferase